MSTYTVTQVTRYQEGGILYDVLLDGKVVKSRVLYPVAFEFVLGEMKPGDIYKEKSLGNVPDCQLTHAEFVQEAELSRKFDLGQYPYCRRGDKPARAGLR